MIFGRRSQQNELDHEIRDYIERETNDNIALGMPPADARHAAIRKLGQPVLNVKEDTRAVWGWIWFERLFQDLRHGIRMLRKTPVSLSWPCSRWPSESAQTPPCSAWPTPCSFVRCRSCGQAKSSL